MGSNASTNVDKLITFGQMALEQGWYDKAREYFDQALDLAPLNREAIKGLSRVDEILRRKVSFEPTSQKPEATPAKPTSKERSVTGRKRKEGKGRVDRVAGRKRRATEKREEMARENAGQEDPRLKWIAWYWEETRTEVIEEEEGQRREQRERSRRARERTKTETRSKPGGKSPYGVLNIKPNATKKEIAAAYRRMAQMYHPDKVAGLGPELRELAEEHMKAINAAYAVLRDPDRRVQYDRMRPAQDGAKVDSTIIVSEDEIVIGGRKITLPCSLDTLSRSIGTPSRVFPNPNPDTNNVYVWDELGVKAYERPGAEIMSVLLGIGRRDPRFRPLPFSPKSFYDSFVQIGSYVLTVVSDAKDLRAAGFVQFVQNGPLSIIWQQRLGKFNLFVETNQNTQRIAFLEISV